jgi:hypothetical protein
LIAATAGAGWSKRRGRRRTVRSAVDSAHGRHHVVEQVEIEGIHRRVVEPDRRHTVDHLDIYY